MFDANRVSKLSIPGWEAVYRAEIYPQVVSFIALHDLSRGWALGGCRMWDYPNEGEALTDVLRLSRGMTFKNAIADLPLGGGKSVIICDPKVSGTTREAILSQFGHFIDWVNRSKQVYCSAEDMNTTVEDMLTVARHTKFIHGISVDPSPHTSWGVFCGIEYAVEVFAGDLFGGDGGLAGKRVLVQGLGKVGWDLCLHLRDAGAEIYVSDVRESVLQKALTAFPGVVIVPPEAVDEADVDVFAPCAKGGVITRGSIDLFKCRVICGSANNQLDSSWLGRELHRRGIVYCPDYVANMGGVCCIQYLEIERLSLEQNHEKIRDTVRRMLNLTFKTGFSENLPFNKAVDRAVKKLVWGEKPIETSFQNKEVFPTTAAIIDTNPVAV